jgi:hypothetical protein
MQLTSLIVTATIDSRAIAITRASVPPAKFFIQPSRRSAVRGAFFLGRAGGAGT